MNISEHEFNYRSGRYLRLVTWAKRRYADPDGCTSLARGDVPYRYSVIEDLAAVKYLGLRRHYPGHTLQSALKHHQQKG